MSQARLGRAIADPEGKDAQAAQPAELFCLGDADGKVGVAAQQDDVDDLGLEAEADEVGGDGTVHPLLLAVVAVGQQGGMVVGVSLELLLFGGVALIEATVPANPIETRGRGNLRRQPLEPVIEQPVVDPHRPRRIAIAGQDHLDGLQ